MEYVLTGLLVSSAENKGERVSMAKNKIKVLFMNILL
jgi:hypothetical protein